MNNKIFDIIKQIENLRAEYESNKNVIKNLEKYKADYREVCVTMNYVESYNRVDSNRAQINIHDGKIVDNVTELLKGLYEIKAEENEREISKLIEKLKSAPSDAATPEQGNETT